MHNARFRIGRVPVDPVTLTEAVDRIAALASSGEGGTVYTPNVDHVVVADADPEFERAYADVSLALVDGTPVFWAGRFLGRRVPEKVSGSDLFEPLVARAAAQGLPVFLLGGGPGVAELARDNLVARYPKLQVTGVASPRLDHRGHAVDEDTVLERVRRARAALVFVACGAPKSELFSHRVRAALAPAVLVCVGAAIDFAAGTAKRAPRWVSRVGLEWAYRLLREPRRLAHRYLVRDPKFFWIFGLQLLAHWATLLVAPLRGTRRVREGSEPLALAPAAQTPRSTAAAQLGESRPSPLDPLPRSQVRPVALPDGAVPSEGVPASAIHPLEGADVAAEALPKPAVPASEVADAVPLDLTRERPTGSKE